MFLSSQDVLISKNILPENQFTCKFLPTFLKWPQSVFSSDFNERKCSLHKCSVRNARLRWYHNIFHLKVHEKKVETNIPKCE